MSDETAITNEVFSQFGRVGRVELSMNGRPMNELNLDGLDFKFNTSQMYWGSPNVVPSSATISILGLSQKSVDTLCQFMDMNAFQLRGIAASVAVGYEDGVINGTQDLFYLPVVRALTSAYPENWTTLTCCLFSGPRRFTDYHLDTEGKDAPKNAMEAIERIGKEVSIHWRWMPGTRAIAESYDLKEFSFAGDAEAAVIALRKRCPYLRFIIENTSGIHLVKCGIYPSPDSREAGWMAQNVWTVNKTSGLIGVPNWIDGTGAFKRVKIRTLLNPSYRPYDKVLLKSDVMKGLDGEYKIINVSHTGHLRGNEWYSDVEIFSGR